jgi:uncharacterized protein YbjT (DUF2867 family)
MSTVLVVGATGQVGRALVERLAADGLPVRAMVRNRKRAASLFAGLEGVTLVKADLADESAVVEAMAGVDKVFLNGPVAPEMVAWQARVIAAAARAAVKHVVAISSVGAGADASTQFGRWHGEIDTLLAESGVPYTILQPQFFVQNLLGSASSVQESDQLVAPMADAAVAMVDVRDVADVAAVVLGADGYGVNEVWTVTGPEALTYAEIARRMSQVVGREVAYVAVNPEEVQQQAIEAGAPEWFAQDIALLYQELSGGLGAEVSATVSTVAGHSGRSVDYFLADFASEFQKSDAG